MVGEHSYCMPRPDNQASETSQEKITNQIQKDHGYTSKENKIEKISNEKPVKQPRTRKPKEHKKLQELQNTIIYNDALKVGNFAESYNFHSGIMHKVRDQMSEFSVLYEFLTKGMIKIIFFLPIFSLNFFTEQQLFIHL